MSMTDQGDGAPISDVNAVNRLFELSSSGDTGNREFWELDNMVQQRLLQAYGVPDALEFLDTRAA